jgi:hypothetical protein
MTLNTAVMEAVESLDYRVTVGDVAAKAGLDLATAQQGILALAADTQAHLQVSEAGEIAYAFPQNFRGILRNKYWRIRLQETWARIWRVLFYLIRISFGILLVVSILLIVAAIAAIALAANSSQQNDNRRSSSSGGGGFIFIPRFWIGDLFWFFNFDSGARRRQVRQGSAAGRGQENEMNFLEAIFSFLFGDGDPNADLDEQRWQAVGTVIRNQGGAIAAEQVAPYLDEASLPGATEDEDYMLPVLLRFNGVPQVSPQGDIIYQFPELQVTARNQAKVPVAAYLKALPRPFSKATSGQITLAVGLGVVNFVGAILLGALLQDPELAAELGGLVAFVNGIYWLLLAYGTAFLGVPAVRYFWIQGQNAKIARENAARQERAIALNEASETLREKLAFAQAFAAQTVLTQENLAYTTEKDLTDQEYEQREKLDAEWLKRLESKDS